jgi:murein DD-endopeptidase MepM/ murein hydrolase activator NlpD
MNRCGLLLFLLWSAGAMAAHPDADRTMTADAPPADATAVRHDRELAATLMIPVKGVAAADLRDTYNERRGDRRHEALDILAPKETPVLAATDGRIIQLMDNRTGGLMIFATDTSERYIFLYAHLDDYADGLEAGTPVKRGQLIGYVGTSGNAPRSTPHLHFAIKRASKGLRWSRGTPVDPRPLLLPSFVKASSTN